MIPAPERAEWKTIWLAEPDAAAEEGWVPVEAEVRTSQLAVFERKVTIGDASRDSDDYVSSWIQGDYSGGGQVFDSNEGADTTRFWWGVAETRFVNQIALPPEVTVTTKPSGAAGAAWPLGNAHRKATSESPARATGDFVAAWGPVSGGGYSVHAWSETAGAWGAAAAEKLSAAPVGKGVAFSGRGPDDDTRLFVPLGDAGDDGYATIVQNPDGTLTVTNVKTKAATANEEGVANGDGVPAIRCLALWGTALWAVDADNKLWSTSDGAAWLPRLRPEKADTETVDPADYVTIDPSRPVRHLLGYMNRAGDPTLFAVTDQDLWAYDFQSNRWELTPVQFPPHPDFGLGAAVWRPGEDLHLSAGMDTVRMTGAAVVVPNAGPSRDEGVPVEYRGKIVDLQPELSCLYALVQGAAVPAPPSEAFPNTWTFFGGMQDFDPFNQWFPLPPADAGTLTRSVLMAWSGTGWHALWEDSVGFGTPTWASVSRGAGEGEYALWFGNAAGDLRRMHLRRTFHNPRASLESRIDRYAADGYLVTSRFDAAMRGFDKIASHLIVFMDWADADHCVEIDYETDLRPGWRPINAEGSRADQTGYNAVRFDPNGDGFTEGDPFNWVRFRLRFKRGDDPAKTPLLDSAVLHYVKIPQNTVSFVFTVPLPRRSWMGRTGHEISEHLNALLDTDAFVKLVHQGREYRGKVAAVSGVDATGEDFSGARTVNFLAVPDGSR